jgi:hypothetical protein
MRSAGTDDELEMSQFGALGSASQQVGMAAITATVTSFQQFVGLRQNHVRPTSIANTTKHALVGTVRCIFAPADADPNTSSTPIGVPFGSITFLWLMIDAWVASSEYHKGYLHQFCEE